MLSARPGGALPDLAVPGLDKIVHVALYVPFGLLLARALGRGRAVLAVGVAVAFGATDELHQAFVPGRTPSLADLLADAVGATLGALAWARPRWIPRLRSPDDAH